MKVVVAGPPHSGKSVFLGGLCECLPRDARYLFRACPDGEGTWTWGSSSAAEYRRKGTFSKEVVDWYVHSLRRAGDMAPIVLVDVGGRMSPENARILREGGVDCGIVLAGDEGLIPEWERFLASCGVETLARVHSNYHGQEDVVEDDRLSVHHLERGEDVSSRPAIQRVAEIVLAAQSGEGPRGKEGGMNSTLRIAELAEKLGKEEEAVTLPNGRVIRQVKWAGTDLPAVAELLHNSSSQLSDPVDIDGAAPAWLVVALTHECHPRSVRLNSPDGFVGVGCQKPTPGGSGPVEWETTPRPDGWVRVEFKLDPSVPLSPGDLDGIAPPVLPMGSRVILSGRGPNWLVASLAMGYHGQAAAVAAYQPGVGSTVCWTHTAGVALGELLPE